VQETLLVRCQYRLVPAGLQPAGMAVTILRNLFARITKRRREVEDTDGSYARRLKTQPSQGAHLEFEEFRAALTSFRRTSGEPGSWSALGFSYEPVRHALPHDIVVHGAQLMADS